MKKLSWILVSREEKNIYRYLNYATSYSRKKCVGEPWDTLYLKIKKTNSKNIYFFGSYGDLKSAGWDETPCTVEASDVFHASGSGSLLAHMC